MADPTLAEMVERLRARGEGPYGDVVFAALATALTEIDRRLTAVERWGRAGDVPAYVRPCADFSPHASERSACAACGFLEVAHEIHKCEGTAEPRSPYGPIAPPEDMGTAVLRPALRLKNYLDACTAQITVDELARAIGLPAKVVLEVVIRSGLRHRWLVGWGT